MWRHEDWARSFDRFVDHLRARRVHLIATSLGGFLAQVYASLRPERVASLVLCNTFCDTSIFAENASCVSMFVGHRPVLPRRG